MPGLVAAAFAVGVAAGFLLDRPAVIVTGVDVDWSDPRALPERARADFRSEFVSDARGYRWWPRSARVEPATAYRFDTGHCGLDFLADFDGSFWQPVSPKERDPDFFFNQDVGAIALPQPNVAVYHSSKGVEAFLVRIEGPVVAHPCM